MFTMSTSGFGIFPSTERRRPWGHFHWSAPERARQAMGWGGGQGKKEVLDPASGGIIFCGSDGQSPFAGKFVFVDISGLAHKASKRDAATVVREGVSEKQLD